MDDIGSLTKLEDEFVEYLQLYDPSGELLQNQGLLTTSNKTSMQDFDSEEGSKDL